MSDREHTSYQDEEYDAFDASEETGGLSGFFVLMVGVLVLATFSAVVWVAYQQGLRQGGKNAPPLVVAEPSPIKVPANDEPQRTAQADREIYDVLDNNAPQRTERLSQGAEEPAERGVVGATEASLTQSRPSSNNGQNGAAQRPAVQTNENGETVIPAPPSRPAASIDGDEDTAARSTSPAPASAPPETRSSPPAQTSSRPATTSGAISSGQLLGDYVVQIASFASEPDAMAGWTDMQRKFGALLDNVQPDLQPADLGDRGVWYRLRVGPFYEQADAASFCAELKARSQDCLVRAK